MKHAIEYRLNLMVYEKNVWAGFRISSFFFIFLILKIIYINKPATIRGRACYMLTTHSYRLYSTITLYKGLKYVKSCTLNIIRAGGACLLSNFFFNYYYYYLFFNFFFGPFFNRSLKLYRTWSYLNQTPKGQTCVITLFNCYQ